MVCQPIISLADGSSLGYEALARPTALPPLDSPAVFLSLAGRLGIAREIESRWRTAALRTFGRSLPDGSMLFLNASPLEFTSGAMRASILASEVRRAGLTPEQVVLELTEGDHIVDFAELRRALGAFRSAGFLVAIDDVGAGPSSLQAIAELRPNFIKLDRWLATDIAFDAARRVIAESMVELARRTRARVVAEGVETVEQLNAFARLGVDAGQGFLLGRPSEEILDCLPTARATIQSIRTVGGELGAGLGQATVADLSVNAVLVDATVTGRELLELFEAESELAAVVVNDGGRPPNIVSRERLLRTFAEQFGPALYSRKSAAEFAVPATCIAPGTGLKEAAHIIIRRRPRYRTEPVVVASADRVVGVIEALDLLTAALEEEVLEARNANPLTGLPGNRRIREYFERMRDAGDTIVVYADIDQFKKFNDRFGFAAGDLAILQLASLLSRLAEACSAESFVGHIGGDDFIFAISERDLYQFRQGIAKELQGKWFDPDGSTECQRLTVTFGGIRVSDLHGRFEERSEALARFKAELKLGGGDCFRLAREVPPGAQPFAAA